jgi:hypothetical protein
VKDVLLVYQLYVAEGKPRVNAKFLERIQAFCRSRPRAKKVPIQFATDPKGAGLETTLRSIRRYVGRAEELMLAAAKADFPGQARMGSKAAGRTA